VKFPREIKKRKNRNKNYGFCIFYIFFQRFKFFLKFQKLKK